MSFKNHARSVGIAAGCLGMLISSTIASAASGAPADLTAVPFAELMNYQITSVSKQREDLSSAAAAVSVITQEDIRRSGMTSIPELLRLVPGVQVARISGNGWAISARGFNGTFAGNLLVLIDGRSVYTPLFSGVYWDVQDTLVEDIDRIEVIRGPGATLWGANAVNGVINIVTKSASETQGTLATMGVGDVERGFAGARHGGRLGERAHYRVYLKYLERDEFEASGGFAAHDATEDFRGGWRLDWDIDESDTLTFQGDVYSGERDGTFFDSTAPPLLPAPIVVEDTAEVSGGNLLLRWSHEISEASDLSLQFYYDRTERESVSLGEDRDTWDLDFQHRFPLLDEGNVLWGLSYRRTEDDITNGNVVSFAPMKRSDDLIGGFLQAQLPLFDDRLVLTAGSKIERNDYSGWEIQPSGRLSWSPLEGHTFWGAVSRAVRSPSRFFDDAKLRIVIPAAGFPLIFEQVGNRALEAEELLAYEVGYRLHVERTFSLDIALFSNHYEDQIAQAPLLAPPPPGVALQTQYINGEEAHSYGLELSSRWQVLERWRLDLSYSFIDIDRHLAVSGVGAPLATTDRKTPSHQAVLRSQLELPLDLELDTTLFYTSTINSLDVPGYLRVDLRLGWEPFEGVELSLTAENLFDKDHLEWIGAEAPSTRVPRSVHARATVRF